jgi:hypothetical protein
LQPSSSVGDIPHALSEGLAALGGGAPVSKTTPRGLLVYIGPGLMDQKQARMLDEVRQSLAPVDQSVQAIASPAVQPDVPPEFLVRLVGNPMPLPNIGITQIALKRSPGAPDEWAVMTQVRNYNDAAARVALSLSVGGHVFREDQISLAPGATQSTSDDFTSRSGGLLQAEITPGDGLAADNRATIVLPSSTPVSVAVVTSRAAFAAKMRAVLSANPYVKTDFVHAGANPPSTADVVVYDGPVPEGSTALATVSFISAAPGDSTHRIRLANWNSGHPVTRWIQSRDVTVRAARSLEVTPQDVVLASSPGASSEPLIVAREASNHRSVVADFDPLDSNFTEEPAFPLLMAASIEWMTHPVAEAGDYLTAGSVDLPLSLTRIVAPSGRDVLFANDDSNAHFFAAESGLYRVVSGNQSLEAPVNVPPLPTVRIAPTAAELAPLEAQPIAIEQQELWRGLVALALIALWLEWRLFYFRRDNSAAAEAVEPSVPGSLRIDLRETSREVEHSRPAVKS